MAGWGGLTHSREKGKVENIFPSTGFCFGSSGVGPITYRDVRYPLTPQVFNTSEAAHVSSNRTSASAPVSYVPGVTISAILSVAKIFCVSGSYKLKVEAREYSAITSTLDSRKHQPEVLYLFTKLLSSSRASTIRAAVIIPPHTPPIDPELFSVVTQVARFRLRACALGLLGCRRSLPKEGRWRLMGQSR